MTIKPCKTCGRNFMPTNLGQWTDEHCNVCINAYKNKTQSIYNPGGFVKTDVQILVTVPREVHIKIEEICMNEGKSFSEFFLDLYKLRIFEAPTQGLFEETTLTHKPIKKIKEKK